MKILNKKESRELCVKIGFDQRFLEDKMVLRVENRFYLISRDIAKISFSDYNIRSYGYLIAELRDSKFLPKFTGL